MQFTIKQREAIEEALKEYVKQNHKPGFVAGIHQSVCACGWTFNHGLKDDIYVSTPEHQEHLEKEFNKLLNSSKLEVYYHAYKALLPYLGAFKKVGK